MDYLKYFEEALPLSKTNLERKNIDYFKYIHRRVTSGMFCLVPKGVSNLPTSYSPQPADPIRDDLSLIHPSVHAT